MVVVVVGGSVVVVVVGASVVVVVGASVVVIVIGASVVVVVVGGSVVVVVVGASVVGVSVVVGASVVRASVVVVVVGASVVVVVVGASVVVVVADTCRCLQGAFQYVAVDQRLGDLINGSMVGRQGRQVGQGRVLPQDSTLGRTHRVNSMVVLSRLRSKVSVKLVVRAGAYKPCKSVPSANCRCTSASVFFPP